MGPEKLPSMITDLLQAHAYPHLAEHRCCLQTHISWVILSGDFAYKIKKPVHFDFLDFSSKALRHHYCQRELAFNRLYAPQLYLDVLPICQQQGIANLRGEGEIIDYCVKMQRFASKDLLLTRLRNNTFDPQWIDQLAHQMAQHHAQASIDNSDIDSTALLNKHMINCLQALPDDAAKQCHWLSLWQQCFQRHQQALIQRQAESHVRHCHGDYHLANLALVDGIPQAFDCIEFNDQFSVIDTNNDAAFLCMDCTVRQRPDLAMRFISRYLEASDDYQGLSCLRLHMAYRAAVRARVEVLSSGTITSAMPYLQLMQQLMQPSTQARKLIAIGGYSGSGKSHLALLGCGIEQAVIIRSDALRFRLHQQHPELQRYGQAMNQLLQQQMFISAADVLRSGWSVILDATFLPGQWREDARQCARQQQAQCHLIWLKPSPELTLQRIRQRQQQGDDISEADENILRQQWQRFAVPQEDDIRYWQDSGCWPNL